MPPVRMTREEYERTYGVPVPTSTVSKIDTTPAPVRMTQAEYDAIYRPEKQETPGLGSKLAERAMDIGDALIADKQSDLIPGRGLLRVGGALTGAAADVASSVINPVISGASKMLAKAPGVESVAMTDTVGTGLEAIQKTTEAVQEKWQGFETKYPNLAQDLRDVGNILSFLPIGQGASKAKQVLEPSLDSTLAKIDTLSTDRTITNRTSALSELESKYSDTRKANEYSKDSGQASRDRISRTDVLVGAVDENGTIRTKQPGGAVEQYRAQTVDGLEDVVKANLIKENKKVALKDVGDYLKTTVYRTSGIEGSDLVTAINGIEKELQGLALRADDAGMVDLAKIQDAKIGTTRNIDFNTPAETKTYRKAIARGYKEFIENTSEVPVKKINEVLARYYDDIERLERLDGKKVAGGRLGKYFAQTSGTLVGMGAGAVAGPLGASVGGVVGGELASVLKGKALAGSFGSAKGLSVPPNKILEAAKKGALPVDRPLNIPDAKPVIPAGITSKEIKTLEADIAKNVKAQQAAIKAGDFTLVKTLKGIYDILVSKLAVLVDEIIESAKNPTIGLSIKKTVTPESVAKKADKDDIKFLAAVIDDVKAAKADPEANKILDAMGLGRATDDELVSFAKEVIDETDIAKNLEVKATPQTTALLEEAKKYKSATTNPQFKKLFDTVQSKEVSSDAFAGFVHRGRLVDGSIKESTRSNYGKGVYFGKSNEFTAFGDVAAEIPKGKRLLVIDDVNVPNSQNVYKQLEAAAKSEGFDGISYLNTPEGDQVVLFGEITP